LDSFANANEVASFITNPDGIPITSFKNSCMLCNSILRITINSVQPVINLMK
jgi:ligand-binding sensor protein